MRGKWVDRTIIFSPSCLCRCPASLATLLLLIFSHGLSWFQVWSVTDTNYTLPVIATALYPMSYITRLTKSSMLDVLGQDYIHCPRQGCS